MKIHVAIVEHKNGSNIYAGETEEACTHQVAEYARYWWEEWSEGEKVMPASDEDVIQDYFDEHPREFVIGPEVVEVAREVSA